MGKITVLDKEITVSVLNEESLTSASNQTMELPDLLKN